MRFGYTIPYVADVAAKPWGQEVACVRDPDGMLVEIASPVS